jgi:hypothetical protein
MDWVAGLKAYGAVNARLVGPWTVRSDQRQDGLVAAVESV